MPPETASAVSPIVASNDSLTAASNDSPTVANGLQVSLTESAAEHIRQCLSERPAAGIRFAVRPSGCSGLAYLVEFADAVEANEITFHSHDICIITDAKSLVHIAGMEVDYVREGLQSGLKFNNPNVKDACGCGESFTT